MAQPVWYTDTFVVSASYTTPPPPTIPSKPLSPPSGYDSPSRPLNPPQIGF